ncbi:hypothetical protein UFOVP81_29 [uncultured Caudovirales phage]|uniref:Uncharacterized protein n=1 Tax=uncultured Caudovirales phage TaxID=2100421 RepID=A0A6J5KWJ2_9CAUD|nr:hypothetical protein UFOVP81_29 [uncultured Caudovirales phage]
MTLTRNLLSSISTNPRVVLGLENTINAVENTLPSNLEEVELQLHSQSSVEVPQFKVDFVEHSRKPSVARRLKWDSDSATLALGLKNFSLPIGQMTLVLVKNITGATITKGSAVSLSSWVDSFIIRLATSTDRDEFFGVTKADIENNQIGYCVSFGNVLHVRSTESWSIGDLIHLSDSGQMTKEKTSGLTVGIASGTDSLFVRPVFSREDVYGVFYKVDSQSPAAINTDYIIELTETTESKNTHLDSNKVYVDTSGVYEVLVSVQVKSLSNALKNVSFWLSKNTTVIDNSCRITSCLVAGSYTIVSMSKQLSLNHDDYIQIHYSTDSTDIEIISVSGMVDAPGLLVEITKI